MPKFLLVVSSALLATAVARADYEEVRQLRLDAKGVEKLLIDAGGGSLDVTGLEGVDSISVTATIRVPGRNDDKARRVIRDKMTLDLEEVHGVAVLDAFFRMSWFGWNNNRAIDLVVTVPAQFNVTIDDGTGSIEVRDISGDLSIEDGTGSILVHDIGGDIDIDDGTGSIDIQAAGGDVLVEDGTGSIEITGVAGSVTIDDGTGGINVTNVHKDLIVLESGTGHLHYENVRGSIATEI